MDISNAYIDIDGTLVDSMPRQYGVLREALDVFQENANITIEEFSLKKRTGLNTIQICESIGVYDKRIAEYWKLHIEDDCWIERDTLFEDAEKFLKNISKYYTVVLLSARNNSKVKDILGRSAIGKFIDEIELVSPYEAYMGKLTYIKNRELNNDILVGDTEVEYRIGNQVSIETFLLNRGFRAKEYWKQMNVYSYGSLLEVLDEIENRRREKNQ